MGYLHIEQLYKDKTIRLFRRCFAMEKIHGTSSHLTWEPGASDGTLRMSPGGCTLAAFRSTLDYPQLIKLLQEKCYPKMTIYGEAYGGSMQGMKAVYGDKPKFIVFDIEMDGIWQTVPQAERIALGLGLEFVSYEEIDTELETLTAARDQDSVQAVRNGCGTGHKREGIVLRPLVEMTTADGNRVIVKYKTENFMETNTPRSVDDDKLKVLADATAIAEEWVTEQRLEHVLQKLPGVGIAETKVVIAAMIEDVEREAVGEIVVSKEARAAIGKRTVLLFHKRVKMLT